MSRVVVDRKSVDIIFILPLCLRIFGPQISVRTVVPVELDHTCEPTFTALPTTQLPTTNATTQRLTSNQSLPSVATTFPINSTTPARPLPPGTPIPTTSTGAKVLVALDDER